MLVAADVRAPALPVGRQPGSLTLNAPWNQRDALDRHGPILPRLVDLARASRSLSSEALVRNAIAFSMMALGRVSLVDCAQVLLQLFAGDLRRVGVFH